MRTLLSATCKYLVVSAVATALISTITACGGGSNDGDDESGDSAATDTSPFAIPGDIRLARVVTITTDGMQQISVYEYNNDGRLGGITREFDGAVTENWVYTYNTQGASSTRLIDRVDGDRSDLLREYRYDGDRIVGYVDSVVGELPGFVSEYSYTGELITRHEIRRLDPQAESPALSDGTPEQVGTYIYNESGFMTEWELLDVDGQDGRVFQYVVDEAGRRLSSETYEASGALVSTSAVEYESAPCIEFPLASLTQWVCVQSL